MPKSALRTRPRRLGGGTLLLAAEEWEAGEKEKSLPAGPASSLKRSMGETSEAIECLRGGAGGRARARPRQLPLRLRRDADRARTASPSNQIWNGKGYGQRPADFSGVSRRCCLIRERTSRVAPTGLEGHIIRFVGYAPTVGGAPASAATPSSSTGGASSSGPRRSATNSSPEPHSIDSRTAATSSRRRARASAFGTPAGGNDGPLARPDTQILGATRYPGIDSTHPQRCTFRPPRAALFDRRSQGATPRQNGTSSSPASAKALFGSMASSEPP